MPARHPALPMITHDLQAHTQALQALKEKVEVYEGLVGNTGDRFLRVSDLVSLGSIRITPSGELTLAGFYLQTPAEAAANITPANLSYPAGNLLRYGGVGDDETDNSMAFESAFAQFFMGGATIFVPAGIYRVSEQLLYELSDPTTVQTQGLIMRGEGMYRTIIKSSLASDAAFKLSITDDSAKFQNGVVISDLAIIPDGTPANQHGVQLAGVYQARFERVRIEGFTGHGIYQPLLDADFPGGPDYYGVVFVDFWGCQINSNGGHGIWSEMGPAFIQRSFGTSIQSNAEGGVYMAGGGACEFRGGSISYNGTDGNGYGGVTLARSTGGFAAGTQTLTISGVEMDRNRNQHLRIGALTCGLIQLVRFVSADEGATSAHVPPKHVLFDLVSGGVAQHITFENNFHRRTDSTYPLVGFDFGNNANISHIRINDRWASNANTTKYDNAHANSRIQIEESGIIIRTNLAGSFARGRITGGAPVVTGSAADVVWSGETTDVNNALDTATGIYVCPATGVYSIDAAVTISGLSAGNIATLKLIQDTGSDFTACEVQFGAEGINHETFQLTRKIYCEEGHELRIQALQNSGSNKNIRVGDPYNWFCVSLDPQ